MNKGEVEYAERRALQLFDDWNEATGVFVPRAGYYFEVVACIEDAVHCGVQMALNKEINIKNGELVRGDFPDGESELATLRDTVEWQNKIIEHAKKALEAVDALGWYHDENCHPSSGHCTRKCKERKKVKEIVKGVIAEMEKETI